MRRTDIQQTDWPTSGRRSVGWRRRRSSFGPISSNTRRIGLGRSILLSSVRSPVDAWISRRWADEIGASVLARFTSFRSMMVVRLRELSGS